MSGEEPGQPGGHPMEEGQLNFLSHIVDDIAPTPADGGAPAVVAEDPLLAAIDAGDGAGDPYAGGAPGAAVAPPQDELTYVWGTGISLEVFKGEFRRFLETYGATELNPPAYLKVMEHMRLNDASDMELDFTQLRDFSEDLYNQTVNHPAECFQMMASVAEEVFKALFPDVGDEFSLNIAAKNLESCVSLRDLAPGHIETLISVKGMVVRVSKIIPEVRVAFFECWVCKNTERSVVERGRIFEPVRCNHCGKQYTYVLVHNHSIFEDKQIIRVQEAPENLANGETPVTISAVVYGNLVDATVPGDRVVLTGIYRSSPIKLNPNTRIIKSVFRTHVDAVHIDKSAKTSSLTGEAIDVGSFDNETMNACYRLSKRPDVYDILTRSVAPSIFGHEAVKMGVLSLMFGGCTKVLKHGKFRAELNIILCGDPGVAKSQLLSQVHKITPRGVYTSGKGSSSVGLTAFVVKDADTGEFVLEPGALVLSDRGICCIDEFDKMDESTRSVLHEVMEQQTLSIAKAGIIAQLNARTTILAAANPKESQWNPTLNIVENLQIEPTLLSRFDLIFLLLDKQDEALDRRLAHHVLAMFTEDDPTLAHYEAGPDEDHLLGPPDAQYLEPSFLSKYIAFAKVKSNPAISEEAHKKLVSSYVEMRQARGSGKTVSATLRQLESMIRLAEARAKMRLADFVSEEDATSAKLQISEALKDAATDPRTGLINLEMFAAGDPNKNTMESSMKRLEAVIQQRYLANNKKTASMHELRIALQEASPGQRPLSPSQFTEMLTIMSGGDFVASFTATTVTFA